MAFRLVEEGRLIVDKSVMIQMIVRKGCPPIEFGRCFPGCMASCGPPPCWLLPGPVLKQVRYGPHLVVPPVPCHPTCVGEIRANKPLLNSPLRIDLMPTYSISMAKEDYGQGADATLTGTWGEWCDSYGLDMAIEGPMVPREELVVIQVAGPAGPEERDNEPSSLPSDTPGGLNVRGRGLGLAVNDH
jgi:hypothetical protein